MRLTLLLALWLVAVPSSGKTVADLESSGRLEISSMVQPSTAIVAGQKIEMVIDIATDRWFAGGTRLRLPEVAGLVILQTNDFASNSTEQRQGQTWVVQRWTLDVYPQRSGAFAIPPVSAAVAISDASDGVIEGKLYSPTVRFEASLPEGLDPTQHWVASPTFSVTQRFDKDLSTVLPGDAISREVVFEATDVMAMMLPSLHSDKNTGLAAYPKAPELSNNSNRGTTTAKRIDRMTYVAELEGQYLLPAQSYYWWDTQTQTLQTLQIPEVEITVGPGSATQKADTAPTAQALNVKPWVYGGLGIALLVGAIWLSLKIIRSAQMAAVIDALKRAWTKLRGLTQPALPRTLNPDNSAEG